MSGEGVSRARECQVVTAQWVIECEWSSESRLSVRAVALVATVMSYQAEIVPSSTAGLALQVRSHALAHGSSQCSPAPPLSQAVIAHQLAGLGWTTEDDTVMA